MTDFQTELLTELLAITLTDFKEHQPPMNLQKEHYEDEIKLTLASKDEEMKTNNVQFESRVEVGGSIMTPCPTSGSNQLLRH